jgi:hypothetical protein
MLLRDTQSNGGQSFAEFSVERCHGGITGRFAERGDHELSTGLSISENDSSNTRRLDYNS